MFIDFEIKKSSGLRRSPMLPHDIALLWSAIIRLSYWL